MRAGFGAVDITPDVGVPLGGNVREDNAARGVHDELWASVAIMQDAMRPVALVGMDLLGVTAPFTAEIAEAIAAQTPIRAEDVIVFATHTHSGPDSTHGSGRGDADYSSVVDWEQKVVPRIAAEAASAWQRMADVEISVMRGLAPGFAFHRRMLMPDGTVRMNWSPVPDEAIPAGPVDDELTVWVFRGTDGGARGLLVHFTLHPAVLVGHEWLVSADYIAALTTSLRERFGDVPVLFANGALGNINHLDARTPGRAIGFAEADRIGQGIAQAVDTLSATPVEDAALRVERHTIEVSQRTVSRERAAWARRVLRMNAGAAVDVLDGVPEVAYAAWTLNQGKTLAPILDVPVASLDLGETTLVFLPFEVFVEFGLGIRDAVDGRIVRVVSLAHDYLGYLPTARAFEQGGYEPTFGTSRVEAGAGEELFARLADRLREREELSA
ncbi:neutral/alkaline non-lysosomal ceramidase N-terminal domain-containing protein [Microbacterium oxydans]|jgi:neutral ceramidase|uniref:neutral/alkaline non-lysosomal ceramidase N-terminal domain-containing protein n=1 Tax=Microbacterium oxydans TaxID=82380 RepID=UPI000F8F86BB|nr:neutral/alkaline non-lysosomal ceramidase N-terminal domain-containing protein [Microbacterium oxydans]AZS48263.1 hypothetical protein CVS53_02982 [Microbacterium oxydans]